MWMGNMDHLLRLLIFFKLVLCIIGWSCLRERKRGQRPPRASVVSASKYRRILAGDVESPTLLPLLLLLLSLPFEGEAISAAP